MDFETSSDTGSSYTSSTFSQYDWDGYMRPPCLKCDNHAVVMKKCGALCTDCATHYNAEYVEYKSESNLSKQKRLRRKFADKWFYGNMDKEHLWAMRMLDLNCPAKPFVFEPKRMGCGRVNNTHHCQQDNSGPLCRPVAQLPHLIARDRKERMRSGLYAKGSVPSGLWGLRPVCGQ